MLGTAEAKKEYFLTSSDLKYATTTPPRHLPKIGGHHLTCSLICAFVKYTYRGLPRDNVGGGIGCGPPMHFYSPKDLEVAALRKYGEDGLKKKREARKKREVSSFLKDSFQDCSFFPFDLVLSFFLFLC